MLGSKKVVERQAEPAFEVIDITSKLKPHPIARPETFHERPPVSIGLRCPQRVAVTCIVIIYIHCVGSSE
jgi:hypothetical protein